MDKSKADGFKGEKAIITPYVIRDIQAANPITKQLYVTHIGYYPNARYHYRERREGMTEYVLIYCEKGSGWIDYRSEERRVGKEGRSSCSLGRVRRKRCTKQMAIQ